MDCDDVMLVLAAEGRTLTSAEDVGFQRHVEECEHCRALAREPREDQFRWIARLPDDAFDDPDVLVLPTVDPIVFAIGAEIAHGGMGRITRARDRRLGRDVAIKEVLAPELQSRFEREAMITARLQHPAIVPIYEAGTWPDGSAFYTMRLVSGGTLVEAIAKTTTLEQRLTLLPHVLALTEALAYAHSRRIVHRDLKPGNVLVGEFGETVVIDWGLAKELDRVGADEPISGIHASPQLTSVGSVIGTPCFIAPEQAAGAVIDERADVYALGAILYNMLVGHPPHWDSVEHDTDRLLQASRELPPTPIAKLVPQRLEDLHAIVERAMARDPAARYPSAKEMAAELRRFEAGQLLASRDYRMRDLLARWFRRYRTVVIIAMLALITIAAVAVSAVINVTHSRDAEHGALQTAERARAIADKNFAALLEEQGRDELLAGDHERALAYLAEAYRRGRDTVALHHLLGVATRDLELAESVIDPKRNAITSVAFDPDGRLVTVDTLDSATIATWDGTKQVDAHPIAGRVLDSRLGPRGRLVAVVLEGGKLAMYDTRTGTRLWEVADPAFDEPTLIFDPAGTYLAVIPKHSRMSPIVQVRDVATGALRSSLVAGTSIASGAAFSLHGGMIATCDGDGTLGVWELSTGRSLAAMHSAHVLSAIAFVSDDKVVTGSTDGHVQLWRLRDPAAVDLANQFGAITALVVSERGDRIAAGDASGGVRLWTTFGRLLGDAHDIRDAVVDLELSPDGTALLGGGNDGHAYVWDTQALALRRAIAAYHPGPAYRQLDKPFRAADHGLAWNADGDRIVSVGSGEPRAYVWRAPRGDRIASVPSTASVLAGQLVVTATPDELSVRDVGTGGSVRAIASSPLQLAPEELHGIFPNHVQASRDGHRVLVWGTEHTAVYDLGTGAKLAELAGLGVAAAPVISLLSEDGQLVFQRGEGPLRLFDAGTGRLVRELAIPDFSDAALGSDGQLVTVSTTGALVLWDVATGASTPLLTIEHAAAVDYQPIVDWIPGHRIVVSGVDELVVVDPATKTAIATLPHVGTVRDIRDDETGHRIAIWTADRTATLWSLDTHAALVTVHEVADDAFTITDDGMRFATGSFDGSIQIWDGATGRLLEIVHGDGEVRTLSWSHDGTRLLAQSATNARELTTNPPASIWDVHLDTRSPAEIVELADRASGWKLVDGQLVPATR